jgi:hypothetical protein
MVLTLQAGLLEDAVFRTHRQIGAEFPRHGDAARLNRMLVLAVASFGRD